MKAMKSTVQTKMGTVEVDRTFPARATAGYLFACGQTMEYLPRKRFESKTAFEISELFRRTRRSPPLFFLNNNTDVVLKNLLETIFP